jgi:uncharacterized membrane protein
MFHCGMTHGEVGQARSAAKASGWRSVRSPTRFAVMLIAGAAGGVAVGLQAAWPFALLAGWDVAALIFSAWTWLMMASMNASATAAHATREEPGRAQTDAIVLLASVANLIAVGYVLVRASSAKGSAQDLLAGLGVVSVALSWFAVHTLFSLRYARLYYSGQPGGINFNQPSPPPRYLDFAYVAFTIGMTFQVSDTDLQTPAIRATALRQALVAYLFGAVTLAATINLISGLATGSSGG